MTDATGRGEPTAITVDVHLGPDEAQRELERDVSHGLSMRPKRLAPTWFYDERGSALFDAITRLPEYYPTRAERQILEHHAGKIALAAGAEALVELGSGTSEKTRLLLDAMAAEGSLRTFIPFDVSEETLRRAGASIAAEHPGLSVHAVVGDFNRHLDTLPPTGPRLVAFLGGTIGNFGPDDRAAFLQRIAGMLAPGDLLLLGTDLVKEPERLVAAYDDSAGVTAEFNRNLLARLNRDLGADFDLAAFEHVAVWDPDQRWVEMRLRSTRSQTVHVAALQLTVELDAGEEILTEISAKFTPEGIVDELWRAGLAVLHSWTDDDGDFQLTLAGGRS